MSTTSPRTLSFETDEPTCKRARAHTQTNPSTRRGPHRPLPGRIRGAPPERVPCRAAPAWQTTVSSSEKGEASPALLNAQTRKPYSFPSSSWSTVHSLRSPEYTCQSMHAAHWCAGARC
eukprot:667769-Pleurochrysis_carterae.AAC.3